MFAVTLTVRLFLLFLIAGVSAGCGGHKGAVLDGQHHAAVVSPFRSGKVDYVVRFPNSAYAVDYFARNLLPLDATLGAKPEQLTKDGACFMFSMSSDQAMYLASVIKASVVDRHLSRFSIPRRKGAPPAPPDADQMTPEEAAFAVAYAYEEVRVMSHPRDPELPRQCALDAIEAHEAWKTITDAPDVVVAVVDSGVGPHDDLPTVSGDYDVYGHGTHVAGLITAETNNHKGIAGTAWKVKRLRSKQFLDRSGRGTLVDAIRAIRDVVVPTAEPPPEIVLLAWGTNVNNPCLRRKIEEEKDILFVAAAGNSAINMDNPAMPRTYPAAFTDLDNLISVMASNCDDQPVPAWFTNYGGTTVHLSAPGDGVSPTDRIYGPVLNDLYNGLAGTSMAAAYVAGAAALVKQQHRDWTPERIRQHLMDTGTTMDPRYEAMSISGKALNLARAVKP